LLRKVRSIRKNKKIQKLTKCIDRRSDNPLYQFKKKKKGPGNGRGGGKGKRRIL